MNTLRAVATLSSCLVIGAAAGAAPASAAPTVSGAEAAVEKKVRRDYRNYFGDGESVVSDCRKLKTTRKEIRYRCDWRILRGYAGGLDGGGDLSGRAFAYGNRKGSPRWYVILY